ncbi:hypothetical protein LFML04_0797 [Leptospirillum ferriphilum ML-04]|uniref:Uncharacterized protein n=1 Tax=Leptospirillum ferriphilum (strain ML-04) TaxID=1048260 RepID=J9ZA22_LEPFM|nr:hypothetical protein LFML04_0797 [Leptospirillum ferriphilum ML-04]
MRKGHAIPPFGLGWEQVKDGQESFSLLEAVGDPAVCP